MQNISDCNCDRIYHISGSFMVEYCSICSAQIIECLKLEKIKKPGSQPFSKCPIKKSRF